VVGKRVFKISRWSNLGVVSSCFLMGDWICPLLIWEWKCSRIEPKFDHRFLTKFSNLWLLSIFLAGNFTMFWINSFHFALYLWQYSVNINYRRQAWSFSFGFQVLKSVWNFALFFKIWPYLMLHCTVPLNEKIQAKSSTSKKPSAAVSLNTNNLVLQSLYRQSTKNNI
jgi:hypothetical protein